ncbi:MAG: hypothetical protein M1822_005013 [Bathelium mastoideum]|nr:MAG: hypothetical protein M1822_005013 [Bathelium mastoideum]
MAIVRRELSALRRPDGLPNTVLQQIQLLSSWENWSTRSVHKSGEEMRIISLSRWIRDIFMQASTQVLFGDTMMQLSPNLMEDFYTFDDRSWMVLYSIPMPWSLKMRLALKRTQHAIKIYLNLSPKRKSDASLVMKQLEEAMKGEGFLQGDAPAVLSLIYWGFNTNAWKACFWCMCYIINDPNLLNAITEEVQPIVETSSCPADLAANLRQCPKLKSTYLETLRFTASTGSARESQTEQLLGGKKIRAHTDLVIVYREMLMDSDIFGIDSDKFVWHRFLNNDELSKGPGFRPFGGGVGQCPGRFLAQSEILSLIALAVTRFNLEVDVVSSVPDLDTKTPSLGMMGPVNGQDMLVRVTRKISEQPDKTSHLARIGS